jgi:hypothetical protein
MHPFEFALALIALVFIYKLVRVAIARSQHAPPRREDPVNTELIERLRQVEERVQVLERIVTDERYDLKQQFKDLGS